MEKYAVKTEGTVSLLQHRFEEPATDDPGKRKPGVPDYSHEWEKALYKMEDGTIYQPSEHIEGAMVRAAANFQITGKGKKTYKDLVKSAVMIEPNFIPHKFQEFVIDRRMVRVQRARIMRERPRFDKWALEFQVIITEDQLSGAMLKEILDYAGRYMGIGDYRPKYGRFQVTHWAKV